jgi:hypothetical protein
MTNKQEAFDNVSATGRLVIDIIQVDQRPLDNTSDVRVFGTIENSGTVNELHSASDIPCSIIGSASFTGAPFGFNLAPGESKVFIDHTFAIVHGINGISAVSFTVKYGNSGSSTAFPDNQSVSAALLLDRIPKPPNAPTKPVFSNALPSTLTVTTNPPTDNGGSAVNDYIFRRYNGSSPTGAHVDNHGNSPSRNLSGLTPGAVYTFTVIAVNNAVNNGGQSPESVSATVQMVSGVHIRVGGDWVEAVPYVRNGGDWKMVIPYIRSAGVWKATK